MGLFDEFKPKEQLDAERIVGTEQPQQQPTFQQQERVPSRELDIEEHFLSFYAATKRLLSNKSKNLKITMTDGEIILRLSRDLS